jgi:hypothetical protein
MKLAVGPALFWRTDGEHMRQGFSGFAFQSPPGLKNKKMPRALFPPMAAIKISIHDSAATRLS